ncbi:hypothetical protein ACRQ1B_18005 [Rhizobium panacihumi]|uniref:hypothetical protein n=1 Tax=Rhizobium panacihumi TaxID=2008450 RepID=UPI003D78E025
MKDITDRNFEIAAARHLGEPLDSLALKHGLHINSVSRIAQENAVLVTRRNNRRIPQGLTVRAAVALEDALGLWPTEKNRRQIAARFEGILRNPVRRAVLSEIKDWLRAPPVKPPA